MPTTAMTILAMPDEHALWFDCEPCRLTALLISKSLPCSIFSKIAPAEAVEREQYLGTPSHSIDFLYLNVAYKKIFCFKVIS
jgi:hypothetical protein